MVDIKRFFVFVLIVSCALSSNAFASNKEELIIAINKTYSVGKESYTLPQDVKVTAINYLRTHYFTEDDCAEIISCINDAVTFANKLGTTDISKISADDLQRGINYAYKAVAIANKAPTIEEMEAKLATEVQKNNQVINNSGVEIKEDKITQETVRTDTNEDVVVNREDNTVTGAISDDDDKNDKIVDTKQPLPNAVYDVDEIDYSKYLTETQFEDVNFEDLKAKFIDEAKSQSFKMILPYVYKFLLISLLIITFIVIIFKGNKKQGRKIK